MRELLGARSGSALRIWTSPFLAAPARFDRTTVCTIDDHAKSLHLSEAVETVDNCVEMPATRQTTHTLRKHNLVAPCSHRRWARIVVTARTDHERAGQTIPEI